MSDEEYQNVSVSWNYKAKLLQVANQEVIEALNDWLDCLEVESALFVVVFAPRSLDGQVNIFQHGEKHLAKDLSPEL